MKLAGVTSRRLCDGISIPTFSLLSGDVGPSTKRACGWFGRFAILRLASAAVQITHLQSKKSKPVSLDKDKEALCSVRLARPSMSPSVNGPSGHRSERGMQDHQRCKGLRGMDHGKRDSPVAIIDSAVCAGIGTTGLTATCTCTVLATPEEGPTFTCDDDALTGAQTCEGSTDAVTLASASSSNNGGNGWHGGLTPPARVRSAPTTSSTRTRIRSA